MFSDVQFLLLVVHVMIYNTVEYKMVDFLENVEITMMNTVFF